MSFFHPTHTPRENFFHEDGHPTNVHRTQGFIHDEHGMVFCGQCACEDAREHANGHWDWNFSARYLDRAGWEPFEAGEGDDWCSRCDVTLTPRHGGQVFR
jgi:hypothetical protein